MVAKSDSVVLPDASTDVVVAAKEGIVALTSREQLTNLASGDNGIVSTFKGDSFADKVSVLKAVTDALPISENLGKPIALRNVVAQIVEIADDKTGITVEAVRVILVDEDGTAYAGVSDGLFKSIQNIFGILGMPDSWPEGLRVAVVEKKSRNGFKFFTIAVV